MVLSPATLLELESVMVQEVQILRKILCNLHSEQLALLEKKGEQVYALLEERLDDMQVLERLASKLGAFVDPGCTLDEILEKLDLLISAEDMELRTLHAQLVALLEAIHKQNDRTHYFIRNYGNSLDDYICWAAAHPAQKPLKSLPPRKKTAIQVLELEL